MQHEITEEMFCIMELLLTCPENKFEAIMRAHEDIIGKVLISSGELSVAFREREDKENAQKFEDLGVKIYGIMTRWMAEAYL
jgi:hypothetical protein